MITPPHIFDGQRWRNLRVGLLGGSFNPAHEGHLHISLIALHKLQLDYIWWLVTPLNPLKNRQILMPYKERFEQSRAFARHPRILVTNLEQQFGTSRSYDTLQKLKRYFPKTCFVWLTGFDNALTFHRWYRWREILELTATAHISRPPAVSIVQECPLGIQKNQKQIIVDSPIYACLQPRHSYWLLQNKMMAVSSTELRKKLFLPT